MIRAHQCIADGWLTFAENCGVTVFSSSDYCRLQHNRAAIIHVTDDGKMEFVTVDQRFRAATIKMGYANPLGLKRIFGENLSQTALATNEGMAALRSKLANRFSSKKTAVVAPKGALKTPRGSPCRRAPANADPCEGKICDLADRTGRALDSPGNFEAV
jgi:hypothetical protein